MTRAHRRAHAALWLIIAPLTAAILLLALINRRPAPIQPPPPAAVEATK